MNRCEWSLLLISIFPLSACSQSATPPQSSPSDSWSVTTWGSSFEIFSEVDPLVAGQTAHANTHVTSLADFSPVRAGVVAVIMKGSDGSSKVYEQRQAKRDGIFVVDIKPLSAGVYDLVFRVETGQVKEEIPAGRVQVGTAETPGGLEEPPRPPHGPSPAHEGESPGTPFLKEQQWRTEFATTWVQEGQLHASVSGPALVVAPSGADVQLTAPVDGVVAATPWPYRGQEVARGKTVFRFIPTVASDRSLPQLQSQVSGLEAEGQVLRNRHERLRDLLKLEAVSAAEIERANAALQALEARLSAARQDLDTATAARSGHDSKSAFSIAAPWSGQLAEVLVSPGQSVATGATLARLVKVEPVWLDVALPPDQAARIGQGLKGLSIRRPAQTEPSVIAPEDARLVSLSPELNRQTSTRGILIEIKRPISEFPIGSAVEVDLLLDKSERAVLIPATSLVDDAGVTVVYEQLSGEAFARREVRILGRQAHAVSVDGIRPGVRIVTKGGTAIRRASLLSGGVPAGHVH